MKFSIPHYAGDDYFIMFGGERRRPADVANPEWKDDRAQRELDKVELVEFSSECRDAR